MKRASIIGSGPNGLSAAIVLAQAGLPVQVFEAEPWPGGAVRSAEWTLPGFLHDLGSAVYPLAAGSPFFQTLPLSSFGLKWIHSPAVLAHPLEDGSCVLLPSSLTEAVSELGPDGAAWQSLLSPFIDDWRSLAEDVLGPPLRLPSKPLLMAQFGVRAIQSASGLAAKHFSTARARALFAGLAAHSFLSLQAPLSASAAILLGAAAHAVGWPIPMGGAQALTNSLVALIESHGGQVATHHRIGHDQWEEVHQQDSLTLFDTSTQGLLSIAGDALKPSYRTRLENFQRAPGVFKVDYALSSPVPWRAADCRHAITVHVGGSFEQIAEAESQVLQGHHPSHPFVLVAQPSLFDPSRAPGGKHVLWAYCHVPNGSHAEMLGPIEAQIERFAPGFRDCILARHVTNCAQFESMNANLLGGDISGGAFSLRQFLFRPTWKHYSTGIDGVYLCSSSTPPGGGVHGMCGYHAAKRALRSL